MLNTVGEHGTRDSSIVIIVTIGTIVLSKLLGGDVGHFIMWELCTPTRLAFDGPTVVLPAFNGFNGCQTPFIAHTLAAGHSELTV